MPNDLYKASEDRFVNKHLRDKLSRAKDKITVPILESIQVTNPSTFLALLMPCVHGPELTILRDKGVPGDQLYAMERKSKVWRKMRYPDARHGQLDNIRMTPGPMDASLGIDYIEADICTRDKGRFNLIYLDFFGQPNPKQFDLFRKIFKLRMIDPGGKLLLTFGRTRCRRDVKDVNDIVVLGTDDMMPIQCLIDEAIRVTKHKNYACVRPHEYKSRMGGVLNRITFSIVEFDF